MRLWIFLRTSLHICFRFITFNLMLAIILVGCSSGNPGILGPDTESEPEKAASFESPDPGVTNSPVIDDYDVITVLSKDIIPAIDDPIFYSVTEADEEYSPSEFVLGVSINGESRAYSTVLLDRHEIVNDVVGGQKIAVTW